MEYFTLYVITFPIIFLICFLNKNSRVKKIPFFLILFFGLIRYDTTTDYSAYVTAFWDIKKGIYDGWFEVGFILFNKLFTFSKWGFVPLLMISLFIPYSQVYKILKREKILVIGSFVFLTLGYFIRFENIVRQGISMGIFFYSINFAIKKNKIKYFLCVLIAILFHTSSIILIPYYFLIRFYINRKINTYFLGGVMLIFYIMYLYNLSGLILNFIITKTPILKEFTLDFVLSEKTLGLTLLFKLFISWLPSYVLKDYSDNKFINLSINMSLFSGLLNLILIDMIVLERLVEFLYIFQLVAISLMIKKLLVVRNFLLLPSCIFLLMVYHYRNIDSYYKDYKYQSIFSENFENNIFYKRYRRWQLINFDNNDNVYRDEKIKISY